MEGKWQMEKLLPLNFDGGNNFLFLN